MPKLAQSSSTKAEEVKEALADTAYRLVRVAIQNFLNNPVVSSVCRHPNRKLSCISPILGRLF